MTEREELEEMLGIVSQRLLADYDRREGVVGNGPEDTLRHAYGTTRNNLVVDVTVRKVAL